MQKEDKQIFIDTLKAHGIGRIEIDFDGSGDSGQIEGIVAQGIIEELTALPWPTHTPRPSWTNDNLEGFVEYFAVELLEETSIDWINNAGGYGTITIIPGNEQILVQMYERYESSELSYHDIGMSEWTDMPGASATPEDDLTFFANADPANIGKGAS